MVLKHKRINGQEPLLIPNSGIRAGYGNHHMKSSYAAKRNRRHFISNIINSLRKTTLEETERTAMRKKRASKCFICRKRGHLFRNCPSKIPSTNLQAASTVHQGQNSENEKKTTKYEDPLHIKGDYIVKGTEHGDWNYVWFVSLSNSKHFTSNKNIFSEFKRCFGIETRENDSTFLFTHGIGEIELETNDRSYKIPCVSYIPETEINLLSMTQLVQQGFEVDIDGSTCSIRQMFEEKYIEMSSEEIKTYQESYLDKYFETLDTYTQNSEEHEQDKIQDPIETSVNKFEYFIRFMEFANKDLLKAGKFKTIFDENIKWFHHIYTEGGVEKEIPPTIIGLEISTYDLYKLVKSYGGYDVISKNNEWEEIANSFGFPKDYEVKFREIYLTLLHIPDSYYEVALRTSSSISNKRAMSIDVEHTTSSEYSNHQAGIQQENSQKLEITSDKMEVELSAQHNPLVPQMKTEASTEELKTQDQEEYILIE